MYLTKKAVSSRCKCAFLVLILCLISSHVWSSGKFYPGAIFTKQNSRLKGHTFRSCVTPSQISCSQACLSNARCYSTNFKEITHQHEGLCELNDEQSLDSIGWENYLYHEGGFIFTRFPKEGMVSWLSIKSTHISIYIFFFRPSFVTKAKVTKVKSSRKYSQPLPKHGRF